MGAPSGAPSHRTHPLAHEDLNDLPVTFLSPLPPALLLVRPTQALSRTLQGPGFPPTCYVWSSLLAFALAMPSSQTLHCSSHSLQGPAWHHLLTSCPLTPSSSLLAILTGS